MEEVTYFIDLRADSAGGNPVADASGVVMRTDTQPDPNPSRALDAELATAVQGRDVLLGTHGFHVNRATGIDNLARWNKWLQLGSNGFFVGVLWPGDSRWLPFIDYPLEGDEAIKSGRVMADYLRRSFAGVNSLSFVSHSLGARTMLEAIRSLNQAFKLKTLTVMAAAIDDTCLVKEYQDAAKQMGKISVMASSCDDVLKCAFPAGNLASGIVTRGDTGMGGWAATVRILLTSRRTCGKAQSSRVVDVRTSQLHQQRWGSCRASPVPGSFDSAASGNVPALYRVELAAGLGRWLCFHEI
jgi:hypothetical protein